MNSVIDCSTWENCPTLSCLSRFVCERARPEESGDRWKPNMGESEKKLARLRQASGYGVESCLDNRAYSSYKDCWISGLSSDCREPWIPGSRSRTSTAILFTELWCKRVASFAYFIWTVSRPNCLVWIKSIGGSRLLDECWTVWPSLASIVSIS